MAHYVGDPSQEVTINSTLGVNYAIRPFTTAPTFQPGEMGYTVEAVLEEDTSWPLPNNQFELARLTLTPGTWLVVGKVTLSPDLPQDVYSVATGIGTDWETQSYTTPMVGDTSYEMTRFVTVTSATQIVSFLLLMNWDNTVDSSDSLVACLILADPLTSIKAQRII